MRRLKKRPRREFGADDKLLHQSEKAVTKESKKIQSFLLQKAIRRKAGITGEKNKPSTAKALAEADLDICALKSLKTELVTQHALRRLGLAHTGCDVQLADGGPMLERVLQHKRMQTLLSEMEERVTERRREKLAEAEGRPLPRARKKPKKKAPAAAAGGEGGGVGRKGALVNQSSSSAVFIDSLDGTMADGAGTVMSTSSKRDHYGAFDPPEEKKRKKSKAHKSNPSNTAGAEPGGRAGAATGKERGERQSRGGGAKGGKSNSNSKRNGSAGGGAAEGPLHGSWAAKRAMKEKEKKAVGVFTGMRTTFGDSD
ncbi:unnamed protein product [Chrysoparadoxa australica]